MSVVTGSYFSTLTPLQLTAGAGLLQNQGLRVNPNLTNAVNSYVSTPLISAYLGVVNSGTMLNATNKAALKVLGSPTCAALSDSIPQYYINLGTFANVTYPAGLTGIITTKANQYLGNGDNSKFAQMLFACDAYAKVANQFIFSACNTQGPNNYLCDTFTDMDNAISGDLTLINLATPAFGQDLRNLGQLINLNNLDNFGSPLALTQQIISVVPGTVPIISLVFLLSGVPEDVVVNLDNPKLSVTDAVQKLMYQAMQNITGDDLDQVLQVLKVTTEGITTMADLLNPLKLFPLSYKSLTVPTASGPRLIYSTTTGSVNTTLLQQLPNYVISSVV